MQTGRADISADSHVVAIKENVSCELDGEAVILSVVDCVYYGLDNVGFAIWRLIQKPTYVWEIRDEIVRQFEVELDGCERDLLKVLAQLKDASLLQVISSAEELV